MAGQEILYDGNGYAIPDLTARLPVHEVHLSSHNSYDLVQESNEGVTYKRYIGSGVKFVSTVAEHLLSHPFLVLRQQSQVQHASQRYHLLPFTLLPTVCHLHLHQGPSTLWKGLRPVLLVRCMSLGVEDLISKLTLWPKVIGWHSSVKQFLPHMLLKSVTFAIVTPFCSASFVETVQSRIASERSSILDVFREGFIRIFNWGVPTKRRMLPIWAIIIPTVALGLGKYLFTMMMRGIVIKILQIRFRNAMKTNGVLPKDLANTSIRQRHDLSASLIATVFTDVVFYPCETVVHRLYLQGTRTIVDNLDNGRTVLPILTNYSGAIDCYENCLASEGVLGLYKGFGALIMQYAVHVGLLRMSHLIWPEVG